MIKKSPPLTIFKVDFCVTRKLRCNFLRNKKGVVKKLCLSFFTAPESYEIGENASESKNVCLHLEFYLFKSFKYN